MGKFLLKYLVLSLSILIFTTGSNWAQDKQSSISNEVETYLRDGIEFANQGKYNEAIQKLNKALELDETDINTLCALGTVYVYKDMYKEDPKVEAIHAGLECGIIGEKFPGMDMISIGPTIKYPHSPEEQVHISTVEKFYPYVLKILENI